MGGTMANVISNKSGGAAESNDSNNGNDNNTKKEKTKKFNVINCSRCKKKLTEEAYTYGEDEILCDNCIDEAAELSQICPACGCEISKDMDAVGLLLTPPGATEEEKKNALDTLVIVCPKCHVLFFDNYHYKLLQGIRRLE